MTTGTARWLAGGPLVLTVAALTVSAGFGVAAGDLMDAFAFAPLLLAFAAVGAIVATHRPANPIGWLFLADGLRARRRYRHLCQVRDQGGGGRPAVCRLGRLARHDPR